MSILYANSQDGYVIRTNQTSWSNARNAGVGTGYSSSSNGHAYAISAFRTVSRSGGYNWNIYRSFFLFSTSSIKSNVSSATFNVKGFNFVDGDLIAVKATSGIGTLGTADFSAIAGWDATGTDGAGAGDNTDNVTAYSDEISTWVHASYNAITLNAQALVDLRDDNYVYICLLNHDNDLKDIEPAGYSSHRSGAYYTDYGVHSAPYIEYDIDNAIFFGTNF